MLFTHVVFGSLFTPSILAPLTRYFRWRSYTYVFQHLLYVLFLWTYLFFLSKTQWRALPGCQRYTTVCLNDCGIRSVILLAIHARHQRDVLVNVVNDSWWRICGWFNDFLSGEKRCTLRLVCIHLLITSPLLIAWWQEKDCREGERRKRFVCMSIANLLACRPNYHGHGLILE